MTRMRIAVAALSLGAVMALSAGGASAATCAYQAQIDAQNTAISALVVQRDASTSPREVATLNAQIAARQAAVADMQAACAS